MLTRSWIRCFARCLALAGLLLLAAPAGGQSPPPTAPLPTATALPAATPTLTAAPTPATSWWDKYGVIALVVSGIIGGVLTLFFDKLLGPLVEEWGQRLKDRLKGQNRRFREGYLPAMAEAHRYLKLVGIHGREGVPPPLLQEVYVSLRMGDAGERLEEARTLTIAEALTQHRRLVILGEPGAGKSTLLDWLTLVFTGQAAQPALRRAGDLLPVFLPLRNCVADERPLHALLAEPALLPLALTPPADFFPRELARGRCLVLLDGLDEVVDERQRARAAGKINDLARTYPANRYVVTCRTAGWKEGLLPGDFVRLYVRDFDEADIGRFIGGWYRAVRGRQAALRGGLRPEERQREITQAEQQAAGEAARLLEALKQNQSLYLLARKPIILSLIALVHYRRTRLPQGRARLYQECLEILLEVWDNEDKQLAVAGPSLRAKEAILQAAAYHLHCQGLAEVAREELEAIIAPLLPELKCPTDAVETLRQIKERSGILVERAMGRYVFAHRTLQEYLVARALADAPEKAEQLARRLRDEPWREVTLLYCGLVADATELVETILAQPDDAACNALLLAGACLAEDARLSPYTRRKALERLEGAFQATTDPLAFERLGETLALLGGEDVVALFGRALESGGLPQQKAAARALGRLGARAQEPTAVAARLRRVLEVGGAGLKQAAALALADLGAADGETLAALRQARQDAAFEARAAALWALLELGQAGEDMIKVPAGEFLMGSPAGEGAADERPQHRLYLPDYYIGRAPVTNAQFAYFIKDDGYARRELWTAAGWQAKEKKGWRQPRYWTDEKWNGPDWPVVGVSCHEALAYARWLGGTLPGEAEWEKAAAWDAAAGRKRRYPWGDDWQPERCNSSEKGPGRTTPVGQYSPRGDSPCGCVDMAGNVWEWCRSLYKPYPYDAGDGREDLEGDAARVVRGGSWYRDQRLARCAYRDWFLPGFYFNLVGFRVLASLASSEC